MDAGQIIRTVNSLRAMPGETECAEFKHNYANAEDIGGYISALSNSAALMEEPAGFIVWGVNDITHDVVGTTFKPHKEKVGNEEGKTIRPGKRVEKTRQLCADLGLSFM